MKKKIEFLLESVNATFEINEFFRLDRFQMDALGNKCDKLICTAHINSYYNRYEITTRNWSDVINEVCDIMRRAYTSASIDAERDLLCGYVRSEVKVFEDSHIIREKGAYSS